MTLILSAKPSLSEFIKTCTPLAIIESLEDEMRQRVKDIAASLLQYTISDDPVENLARFLKADPNFLGIVLALTNLSQEKFKRILSAQRFVQGDFGNEWGTETIYRKFRSEEGFAESIAQLFLEGRNNALLVQQVAAFYLDQLSLPDNWSEIIRDPQLVQNVIRHKLKGEYNVKKGAAIEKIVRSSLDTIQKKYGVTYSKGQIRSLGKEVDHVLPSLDEPYVVIMSSYMETTAQSQTSRANEQRDMYFTLQKQYSRYNDKRVFVNFVDGAGWLARGADLRKLHHDCDYLINLNTIDLLEAIICKYVPKKYFTLQPRPQVEG